uniref:LRAT domain-containing protein n=1 Tax=Magallana gigas TaxID=29159 RepID=A0A8W8NW02_MAGGI
MMQEKISSNPNSVVTPYFIPGNKMSTFRKIQEHLESLKVGDLLEIQRDEHVHWAVYIGNNEVVHLKGVDDGERANQGESFTISGIKYNRAAVIRENILDAVGNSNVRINNTGDENFR